MNLHSTEKESKQSEGSLFKKDFDQLSAVKRSSPNCYVDWKVTLISLKAPVVHAVRGKEFVEYDKPFVLQPQLGKFARNVSISTTIIGSFSGLTPISNEKSASRQQSNGHGSASERASFLAQTYAGPLSS